MRRHPLLRLLQLLCAATSVLLAALAGARPRAAPRPFHTFTMSLVGEREREDGSWEGVDLLTSPQASIERAQLQLRVQTPSRLYVDAVEEGQVRALFPQVGESNIVRPGALYAVPGPTAFYDVRGNPTLRVTLIPLSSEGEDDNEAEPARRVGGLARVGMALTDGATFQVLEGAFRAQGAARLELPLAGGG